MSTMNITIKDQVIPVRQESIPIHELVYYKDNPRVHSIIKDKLGLDEHGLQTVIGEVMKQHPSVKNLLPRIRQHGGLVEPIVVIWKTRQVLEGNSRLAAFRILHDKSPSDERWQSIPCHVIDSLSQDQQDSYLAILHQDGKTPWSAYEKANHIYRRHKEGQGYAEIAETMGVTQAEVKTRIAVMDMMKENSDENRSNYSHYDVLTRTRVIKKELDSPGSKLRKRILALVKQDENKPAAKDLRDKLPTVINNKRQYKKYLEHGDLDQAYLDSKSSSLCNKVQRAKSRIEDITNLEIGKLSPSELSELSYHIKKLEGSIARVKDMIKRRQEQ